MNAQSDELLYYNAIPRLEIDGQEDVMAATLLQSMEMTESEGGMSSLEMAFKNAANLENSGNEMPFETSSNTSLSLGAEIRVVSGPNHDPQEVFVGRITGLELVMDGASVPLLIVLAEDKLQTARLKRRTKLFEEMTLGDLVDAVVQESGLTVVAAELDMDIAQEMQANETDLGFLRRICARFDVDFQIVGTELHISPRALVDRGTKQIEFGQTLTSFRGLADLAQQVSEVTLAGWDHAANAGFHVTSGAGVQAGAGQGRRGPLGAYWRDCRGHRGRGPSSGRRNAFRAPAPLCDRRGHGDRRSEPAGRHASGNHRRRVAFREHLLRHPCPASFQSRGWRLCDGFPGRMCLLGRMR